MIKYEVYTHKKELEFESLYPYKEGHRLFLEINGVLHSLIVNKVTMNHTREVPYVRLNCMAKKYVTE